ncbi:hypothetical protein GCM10009830_49040 [Glycomyces endophyticus]|uniref:Uncharacterized protein n=1 Tax=Glycomyces endophyticus TaxID=480996 RepID=A0ABP4TX19_9ACTN
MKYPFRGPRRVPLLLLLAMSLALSGCALFSDREPLEWTQVVPEGDCRCADGSPFAFWERRADTTKVVLFLNGGGVCWTAATCAFTGERGESDAYTWSVQGVEPENRSGMFDTTRGDNPFADFSFVYVPACTGDAHLGDAVREYAPGLTVAHRGAANGAAALAHLAAQYPDAEEVVVVGKTAGSVAAPVYGGLVADLLPDAEVTVFGAQSGAWPDHPGFNTEVLDTAWGAYDAAPAWATDGLTADEWGVPQLWVRAGLHRPDLVLGRFDFAYDPNATSELTEWLADPPDLLAEIDRNEAFIEGEGVPLHSFTAPGADHQIFEPDKFYDLEVEGVGLAEWVEALVGDDPPADVHCSECSG